MDEVQRPMIWWEKPILGKARRPIGGGKEAKYFSATGAVGRASDGVARLSAQLEQDRFQILDSPGAHDLHYILVIETLAGIATFEEALLPLSRNGGNFRKTLAGLALLSVAESLSDPYQVSEEDLDTTKLEELTRRKGAECAQKVKDRHRKSEGETVYALLTDLRAVDVLIHQWNLFEESKESYSPPPGLAPLRDVFKTLKSIRKWGPQDRLEGTGIIEYWQSRIDEVDSGQPLRFCVEFAYHKDPEKRTAVEVGFRRLLTPIGGALTKTYALEDIGYHGGVIQLPGGAGSSKIIKEILSGEHDATFVGSNDVLYFTPIGQSVPYTGGEPESFESTMYSIHDSAPLNPRLAILDGCAVQNHPLLLGKLSVRDPLEHEALTPSGQRHHGTGVASLCIRGDLNDHLAKPLKYGALLLPLMHWEEQAAQTCVPDSRTVIELVHVLVVEALKNADGTDQRSEVVVVNLSVGDRVLPLRHGLFASAWARLLDWLSYKYGLLFVVSTGNMEDDLELAVSRSEFFELGGQELRTELYRSYCARIEDRRIYSPAEAINALAVGRASYDLVENHAPALPRQRSPANVGLPSLGSRAGLGVNKSVKPDVIAPGGRDNLEWLLHDPLPRFKRGRFGQLVACPVGNTLDQQTIHSIGSTNAAALTSRLAVQFIERLEELNSRNPSDLFRLSLPPLLRALVVHCATPGKWEEFVTTDFFASLVPLENRKLEIKKMRSRLEGYGLVSSDQVSTGTTERITFYSAGSIKHDESRTFRVRIPVDVIAKLGGGCRRLSVTLAYTSPIAPVGRKYRQAKVWYEVPKRIREPICVDDTQFHHIQNTYGTVQHQMYYGEREPSSEADASVEVVVNCRVEEDYREAEIPYGIVASFEVAEPIDVDVYQAIKQAIQPRVAILP